MKENSKDIGPGGEEGVREREEESSLGHVSGRGYMLLPGVLVREPCSYNILIEPDNSLA